MPGGSSGGPRAVTDFHLAQPPEPATAATATAAIARRRPEIRITPEELHEIELAGEEA